MPTPTPAAVLPDEISAEVLLHHALDVSLTGIQLLRPVYAAEEQIPVDFAFAYTNPAGLRISRVTEQLRGTLLEIFPHTRAAGVLAYYQRAFAAHEPLAYEVNYQADGVDNYLRFQARRSGEHLLVSFTDTSDQPRSAVEEALRASQAHEQEARAETERQRGKLQRVNEELEERVRAQTAQVREQQRRLQHILENVPAAIATLSGPQHHFSFANARYQYLVGDRAQAGLAVAEALPEVVEQGVIELLDRVYETGEPYLGRNVMIMLEQPPGPPHQHYYDLTYLALRDGQNQVQDILVFAVEVTEQVRVRRQATLLQAELLAGAQRQLQQREELYQVFEQTPAAVSLLRGPTYRFEYVNPVYQQVFAGRQLVGLDFAEALPDAAQQGYLALLDGVYQTGETFFGAEVPFVSERPDAPPRTVYFTFTYQAYRENGEIVGISTFALDVTEQVLARQERETQRQELEQLFRQAPAPIVILDGPDLVFQLVNPAYQHIFPGRALAGKPLLEALPELVGTPIPDLFRHVYQTGEPVTVQELPLWMARYEGHAPEEIYWTFTYQARRATHGGIDGVRVFAHDVTEQVRTRQRIHELNQDLADTNQELATINEELIATNEELHESNTRLKRTNIDLDTFVYTASHDLKAPITNIESILLALRDTLPAPEQQDTMVAHLLGLLGETVARFQFTIGQLTDISRLQLAHAGPAEPVELARVVADVRLDLAPLLHAAGTQLTVDIAPELVVPFSPANLRSVVYNLLSNAAKYRAPDRPNEVQVRAKPVPSAVVLTVQDNGLGMSEVQQRQLFGLFQRLHTHVEGTGVGLYITKRLVENVGGTIAVASQPDLGTTFTVTFPA